MKKLKTGKQFPEKHRQILMREYDGVYYVGLRVENFIVAGSHVGFARFTQKDFAEHIKIWNYIGDKNYEN